MVSRTESSMGSMPLAQLARLQAQILMQGRVPLDASGRAAEDFDKEEGEGSKANDTSDGAAQSTAPTIRDPVPSAAHPDRERARSDGEAVIAESADAYRTPVSSPQTRGPKVPRLESAGSAPTAEMEATANQLPSQEAIRARTKAGSLHGYEGGDTQPLESQVWQDWQTNMAQSRAGEAVTPKKAKPVLQISPDGKLEYMHDTNATGRTPRTLQEGDNGYVDFANAYLPEPASPTAASVSDYDDLLEDLNRDPQLPAQEDVFQKPALPKTPSLAGHKRRRSGEMVHSEQSAKKTPGFSRFAFKAQKGDMMTATQLFEQTQARSSPIPDGLRSDPAVTRPSPNMQQSIGVSSPTVMMSSPIHDRAPPATAGEPRDTYTSIRESQDRKRARLEADFGLKRHSADGVDDFEEDDEDSELRRATYNRLQRAVSEQALHELSRVRMRSRPNPRPSTSSSPHKAPMIDLRTPATTKKDGGFDFPISEDGHDSGDEPVLEDERFEEDVNAYEAIDEDPQSENDVYDELGQTVLRSQGPGSDGDEEQEYDREEQHNDDMNVDRSDAVEENVPHRTLVQGSSQQDRLQPQRRSQPATQHSAIADSQPVGSDRQCNPIAVTVQCSDRSPSCSYVPGSQYAGRTSQDQAPLPARREKGSKGPSTLSTSKLGDTLQKVVPSSPPLDAADATIADNTVEGLLHREETMVLQGRPGMQIPEQVAEQEIPESDLPGTDHPSSRPATAGDRLNTESNSGPFSTARSHLSASGPSLRQGLSPSSPLKVFASQQSKVSSQSPRTKAGVKHFIDIAGPTLDRQGTGDTQAEIDAVMSGLLNAEDQKYLDATSSPPRPQRRRRTAGKPSIRSSSPVKDADAEAPETAPSTANVEVQDRGDHDAEVLLNGDHAHVEKRILRNSPSKANEQRRLPPPPESTPESVKEREQAGAKAASKLLSKRNSKAMKPTRPSRSGRKAGSKGERGTSEVKKKTGSTAKGRFKRASATHLVQLDGTSLIDLEVPKRDAEEPEIEETFVQNHEEEHEVENVQEQQSDSSVVIAPHRVFALFRGTYNAFYSATWLAASSAGHRVKFDDSTVTTIDSHLVSRLEFALGDQIKVDWEGMKNKTWIVKGFGPALPVADAQKVLTDIHGHETIKVQAKSTRGSVSGPNAIAHGEGEVISIAIEVVYLTHTMWPHFSGREFQPAAGRAAPSRLETPSAGVQTPVDTETPASRSRRAAVSTLEAEGKRASFLRDESTSAIRAPSSGLFYGMAFAVSYGQNESEKQNVTRLIQRNGGTILDDGFEVLFDPLSLDDTDSTSPSRKSVKDAVIGGRDDVRLRLKAEHKDLGFVALIADKHSRRAKYIQALALGIPTLSGRWITDCLDTAKNGSLSGAGAAPFSWTKYLLAAGESSYLNGAIRSRDITTYDAATAKLDDTLNNRPLLLNGEDVLVVASKKGKAVWERRKAFAFLTLALGAGQIKRVSDLQEAKSLLTAEPEKWAFVYVDGSVADASTALFGKGGAAENKKQKCHDGPVMKLNAQAICATHGKIKVVNDEFVVQSLILGALVE